MSSGKKKGRHGIIRIAGASNVHVECGGMTLYTVLICHFLLSTHCFNGFSRRYGLLSSVWLVGIMMFFRHKQVFYPQEPLHITNKNIVSFIYISPIFSSFGLHGFTLSVFVSLLFMNDHSRMTWNEFWSMPFWWEILIRSCVSRTGQAEGFW